VGNPLGGSTEWGGPGAGGAANSQLWLDSSTLSWDAQITGTSTAIGGRPGDNSPLSDYGAGADAVSSVSGNGRATSVANATGQFGGGAGGVANARASADSNYIAIARANAYGGGAFFNGGAGAYATANATAGYFANAEAMANPGTGRLGWTEGGSASARATVTRLFEAQPPLSPTQPFEARAHALFLNRGGVVEAQSTYTDYRLGAAVTTRAVSGEPDMLYTPEAFTIANVGGAAYGPWTPGENGGVAVVSYASALPTAASVAPLIGSSAEVSMAFNDATTLAAGTMAAMFTPMTATAEFSLPFEAGNHLLLALVRPFFSPGYDSSFSFSVINGGVSLYSASFTTLAQANAVFNGHVMDLGVVGTNGLDLLLTFTLESGIYGFSYLIGQGGAPTLAPVPEPGSWMLLMLGLAVLGWRAGAFKTTRFDLPRDATGV
jgi:hypothetical protein